MMKRITGCLPILMLLTAIACMAQPPVHTFADVPIRGATIYAQTKLKDGRSLAVGQIMNRIAYLFVNSDGQRARVISQSDDGGLLFHRANGVVELPSGSILSIADNTQGNGLKSGAQVCHFVPGQRTVSFTILDARPDIWALMKDGTVCLLSNTFGRNLVKLDVNGSRILSRSPRMPSMYGRALVPLSNGDVLLTGFNDTTLQIARFTSSLQLKWAKEIRHSIRFVYPPTSNRIVAVEKRDGTIVLAHVANRPTYLLHHLDTNGTFIASKQLITPWASGEVRSIVEDGEGRITVLIGPGLSGAGTFSIAPDLSAARIFRHCAYTRPDRVLDGVAVEDAQPGRLRLRGFYRNEFPNPAIMTSIEWPIDGEMPCDIVPYSVHLTPVSSSVTDITNAVPKVSTSDDLGVKQSTYRLEEDYYSDLNTYPCTSMIGTTSSTTVLSGASRELGLDGNIEAFDMNNLIDSVHSPLAAISKDRSGTLRLHTGMPASDALQCESPTIELDNFIPEEMELSPVSARNFILKAHRATGDSVLFMEMALPSDGPGPLYTTGAMFPIPPRTRLVRQNGNWETTFVDSDSAYMYGSSIYEDPPKASVRVIPLHGGSVHEDRIMNDPPRLFYHESASTYAIVRLPKVVSIHAIDSRTMYALRLDAPDRPLAIVKGKGYFGNLSAFASIVLPDNIVDSIHSIHYMNEFFTDGNGLASDAAVVALGRVGDDACIIRAYFATGYVSYRRIKHEGMRLVPLRLQRLEGRDLLLWCEGSVGKRRSIISIPTNFFGQAACDEGWSRTLRIDSLTSYAGDTTRVPMRSYTVTGKRMDAPKVKYPTMWLNGFDLCDSVQTTVQDEWSAGVPPGTVCLAIGNVIPGEYIPSTARSLTVRDIQGRIMMSVHFDTRIQNVSTTDLVPGVYVMIMEHETGKITTLPFMVMQR